MQQAIPLDHREYTHKLEATVDILRQNGFTAQYCDTSAEAVDYVLAAAASAQTIGCGGSMTIESLALPQKLLALGKTLISSQTKPADVDDKTYMRQLFSCDLFLTSTNALTATGHLVNMDGIGNRVAPMIFGPDKTLVVVGRNKLVADNRQGLERIHTLAAPANCKRLGKATPCVKSGYCMDCQGSDRACRATVILERQPRLSLIHILLVNEDLGF